MDLLIDTLEKVNQQDKELHMARFYKLPAMVGPDTTLHNCGTAACIIGYGALDPDIVKFLKRGVKYPTPLTVHQLWSRLAAKYGDSVTEAIAMGGPESRRSAYKTLVREHGFPYRLSMMPHLRKDYPTVGEAADFLIRIQPYAEKRAKELADGEA